jgi:phosphate transport system permease protein
MSPYEDWHHLAWAGALLITLSVLFMNIVARTVLRPRRREK